MASASTYDYDLVVIGGGSGGLATAKELAKLDPNKKIACFDLVLPSPHGTRWGLGGTCVNVGCIPKKLMHFSGTLGQNWHEFSKQFGWLSEPSTKHDWSTMSHLITDYILSLNFSYRVSLRAAKVKYLEAYASFLDNHTIAYKGNSASTTGKLTFDKAIIATGGRPTYGICPGSELAISSDDIFWRDTAPGKTLVIGAGYIALECASFLHHIGTDTTVMIRGEPLRKMDRQSGLQVVELMERSGVRFLAPCSPHEIILKNLPALPNGSLETEWHGRKVFKLPESNNTHLHLRHASGATEIIDLTTHRSDWKIPPGPVVVHYKKGSEILTEEFDTVLLAVGRTANVAHLNLPAVGVETVNGKILVDKFEQTTANNIFAIGDVATGIPAHNPTFDKKLLSQSAVDRPELTPVAIKAGLLLAARLTGQSRETMNYQLVPTTVFTSPSEYAFVGLSEEEANRPESLGGIGAENVRVFYSRFGTIEISPTHPHGKPYRSNVFTKKTWAHYEAEARNLDWGEVSFDTDTASNVIYTTPDGKQVNAVISEKKTDEKGVIVYDIVRDDNGESVNSVYSQNLVLQTDAQKERNELFEKAQNLAKLVVDKRNDRVVGVHFVGGGAGEVIQGFTLALKLGATKKDFDEMVGIHPIAAEEFAVLTVTKESGQTPLKKAGCGGGSCG